MQLHDFKYLLAILLFTALAKPVVAKQLKYQMKCDLGKDAAQTQRANGSTIILAPSATTCRVSVVDVNNKLVFGYTAPGIQVYVGAGPTGGTVDAVIQADTFNPYRLFIVSLGEHPRLLGELDNKYGMWLQDSCGNGPEIWTSDDAFQGDPDLMDVYHNDVYVPDVVFVLSKQHFVDATASCRSYFDKEIAMLRSQLRGDDIEEFRSGRIKDSFHRGRVKGYILKIVFCYLYTGQQAKAKRVIADMWPYDDQERVWNSILKLRSEGVLRQTELKQPATTP
ncbi:MAG TPA: hypothetical protein VKB26_00550 [Candidatus Acidoferrales bacterium]|nr:hypothetical protein [Candidatus Acidoferrales bacterium]